MSTYDVVAQQFLQHYYAQYDTLNKDGMLSLYHPDVMLSMEGTLATGVTAVKELLETKLRFQKCVHSISVIDSQPTPENGVLIMVVGQLKTDDDLPLPFNEMFYLRPANNSYFITNQMFRLSLHNQ